MSGYTCHSSIIAAMVLLLWSCTRPPVHLPDVLHINALTPLTSLDPAFARNQTNNWVIQQLFDGLVQLDSQLQIRPALAHRWNISIDGLTYTFHLRTDVWYHQDACFGLSGTRRLLATDVVWSLRRLINPALASPGAWLLAGQLSDYQPIEAPNDSTVVLRLRRPCPQLLAMLATPYCSILPPEASHYYGDALREHPVGTGPFRLVHWREGEVLLLHRHPRYHERDTLGQPLPHIRGIRFTFVSDRQTAFRDFSTQKTDILVGVTAAFAHHLLTPQGQLLPRWVNAGVRFRSIPFLNTEYIGIRLDYPDTLSVHPLHHPLVRQAMAHAIDRAELVRNLRYGLGIPATQGFVPPALLPAGATDYGSPYHPQKARELLQQAGYPDGKGIPPLTLTTNSDYTDLCTFTARQWEDLGLQVRVQIAEAGTLRTQRDQGQLQLFRASWIADYPDAESFLCLFYGKHDSPPNFTRFKNTRFDNLYQQAQRQLDKTKRDSLYSKMDALLAEQLPAIPLFYDVTALFEHSHVQGLPSHPLNWLLIKHVQLKPR